jgi:5'-nucleotidase
MAVHSRSSKIRLARLAPLVLVAAAVATPFAVGSGGVASGAVIGGASSLTDRVEVSYAPSGKDRVGDVHLLAFNDFHGNLEPGTLNLYGRFAGGAAYLAKAVKDKQQAYRDETVTVMAGDGIGAAPLVSQLFLNEPAIVSMNLMGVDYASVGNHEFDKGRDELLRMQQGGCPSGGCTAAPYTESDDGQVSTTDEFPGASFQYLSANVVDKVTGKTLFPAYGIKKVEASNGRKVKVGIIGEVLKDTPTIVTPSGVAGLDFQSEIDAANRAVADLKRRGVNTIVLVIHQGGSQTSAPAVVAPNSCQGNLAGSPIETIATGLDPAIGVIVSGHTHQEYRCTLSLGKTTRLITSASSFGRVLTDINLTVNTRTGGLVSAAATNSIVENALNPTKDPVTGTANKRIPDPSKEDATVKIVVDQYVAAVAPLANRVIGKITGDLTRTDSAGTGETTLGDVIADSQLEATKPANLGAAQVAFMNPGGVRADLIANFQAGGEAAGEVTYGEAFTVQPFGNSLVTKTMTGAQIRTLLEQQFVGCGSQTVKRILQISAGLNYRQNAAASACADHIGVITVAGVVLNQTDSVRVTMNNFLATGGDGFTTFNEGTNALGGAQDIDAFTDYLASNASGIAPPALNRISPIP